MKECKGCCLEKEAEFFDKNRKTKDGLQLNCRDCRKTAAALRHSLRAELGLPPIKGGIRDENWVIPEPDATCLAAKISRNRAFEKARYLKNKQKVIARSKAWARDNPDRSKCAKLRYEKAKPYVRAASVRRYQASKIRRTPKWLSDEDFKAIRFFYELAKAMEIATGVAHHVDHIIPLRGKLVSGLHVPSNLQVLSQEENCRKANTWAASEIDTPVTEPVNSVRTPTGVT